MSREVLKVKSAHKKSGFTTSNNCKWLHFLQKYKSSETLGMMFSRLSFFTYFILKLTSFVVPLRVDEQEEIEGLDLRSHGEKGYHSD